MKIYLILLYDNKQIIGKTYKEDVFIKEGLDLGNGTIISYEDIIDYEILKEINHKTEYILNLSKLHKYLDVPFNKIKVNGTNVMIKVSNNQIDEFISILKVKAQLREKDEKLQTDNKENTRLKLVKELVSMSDSLLLTDLAEALELSRGELMKRLVLWKDYGIRIDADRIIIENQNDFLNKLDEAFDKWKENEDFTLGKV